MARRLIAVWMAGVVAVTAVAAADDKELEMLAGKAGALKSYTFTVDQQPGDGRAVEGKYQAGQPVYFKADGLEFYRDGDVLVYQDGGRWQRTRTGTLSDPLRILAPSARVRKVATLPHEELARLAGDLTDVKKTAGKQKGTTLYTGTLTAAALKKWAATEVRSVVQEGTVKVSVADGQVTRYTVSLRLKGRLGNAEVDGTSERTVEVRDVGSTKVDVPAPARKALE